MKLTKINYGSAVFFGLIAFAMYLAVGILQWSLREVLLGQGMMVTAVSSFVYGPIIGGIVGYLSALAVIAIYNLVAKKYPIAWTIKK
ncbi:hypothetical protein K8R30_04290 [archaeon]|nr:hypothetical protein [archaeon]